MKLNKFIITAVMSTVFICSAITWESSYESAISRAKILQSPVLIYFFTPQDQNCAESEALINTGLMDFLSDTFIMAKIDVMDPSNRLPIENYNITQIPVFILEDFDPERRTKVNTIVFSFENIFLGLFELYGEIISDFISLKQYNEAYACLKLIENLPGELGANVRQNLKSIEPKASKKTTSKAEIENTMKAETYMNTALSNMKNNNFDKAYIYFQKVSELVPGTELGKQAEIEKNKIKEKVDPSLIQKK